MPYQPPVRDYAFILRDLLELERYANLPAFADASMDTIDQILDEAAKFTSEVLAPLNGVGDKEGCHWASDNTVTTPKGFKEAYRQLVDGEHGVFHVPGPDPRRLFGDPCRRDPGPEGPLPAEAGLIRVGRHHEPDRAAVRHGPGAAAHQGGPAGRRDLQDF